MATNTQILTGTGGLDTRSFQKFSKALRRNAPTIAVEMRDALRASGEIVANDARNRASFSSKIPGSIKTRVASATVSVVAGGKKAPDAEVFENKGQEGNFRHPLFGDKKQWYTQEAHPFLRPAVMASGPKTQAAVIDVLDSVVNQVALEAQ